MTNMSISSYGVYVPSNRMERTAIAKAHSWALPSLKGLGKGQKAFCNWDEDTITMAVEASRACIKGMSKPVNSVVFASTTPVYADLQNASIVAGAMQLKDINTMDTTGSLRAGTSSLINAFNCVKAGNETLLVASDNRQANPGSVQEMQYGAGSVALGVSADGGIADFIGSESSANVFVDHFRAPGRKADYFWEQRWIRDEGYAKIVPPVVSKLLDKAGITVDQISHFSLGATIKGADTFVARKLGIAPEAVANNLFMECGDTGTPHPLIMLVASLEKAKPGDYILVVGFGAGCDAILLQATDAVTSYQSANSVADALATGRSDEEYLRLLSFNNQLELDWGMRAESDHKTKLTQAFRAGDQLTAFVGGKCSECNAIQFPVLSMCVNCHSSEPMAPAPLADAKAEIMTCTEDWLQYCPSPPLKFGMAQFDNGARVLMEFVDISKEQLQVGTPLRMVFRIKENDKLRGYTRYFWKAAPAENATATEKGE